MEKLSQKWCIITLLEDIQIGYEFNKGDWPLHLTLAGVHAFEWNSQKLMDNFALLAKNLKPFTVKSLYQGNLGSDDNPTKVTFIEKSSELMKLHEQIIKFLESNKGVFNNSEWSYEGYIPHSTVQNNSEVLGGDELSVNNLAVVDMYPNHDGHRRKVVCLIKLTE